MQIIANHIKGGEFGTPESLVLAAIGRYLDEQAEIAHTDVLIAESDASGPAEARILP